MKIENTSDLVTVNIIELSCELAEKRLIEYYKQFNSSKSHEELEDMIFVEHEDNESICYSEHAQDLFNQLYDEYYSIIEKLVI